MSTSRLELTSLTAPKLSRNIISHVSQHTADDTRTPFLCDWVKSPAEYGQQTVFQRRGILIGLLGDRADEITHASWVDGMGVWLGHHKIAGRAWHMCSLASPEWSFRPGPSHVDYYHENQFVARRSFTVLGRIANEKDIPDPVFSSATTP